MKLEQYMMEYTVMCCIIIFLMMKVYMVNNLFIVLSMLSFISIMFVVNKDIEIEEKRYEYMLRRRI
jgi:hypothetical protein